MFRIRAQHRKAGQMHKIPLARVRLSKSHCQNSFRCLGFPIRSRLQSLDLLDDREQLLSASDSANRLDIINGSL